MRGAGLSRRAAGPLGRRAACANLLVSVDPAIGRTGPDVDQVVARAGALTGPGDR